MAKKILSIETGGWWTKVVLTEPHKKSAQIYDMFYFRTPENTVEDGMVRDRERFLTALKEELASHQVTEKDVIFTINSTKVITREATIPFVKDKLLPGIVDAQAKDYFPMDISSYTVTFRKMDEYTEDGKKMIKLLLIAVPDNILSNYMALAKAGGFNIESFEYIGNSVLSFAKTHYNHDSIIVQLEENETIISVLVGKKLMFQRVAPNGYRSALTTVLDHPVLNVEDEPQAYHFLTTHNMLYKRPKMEVITEEDERKQKALEDAYADVRDSLSYHIRVVLTALDYYRNQSKKDFFGVMRLTGDGARIAGIKKLFTDEIPLELSEESTLSNMRLAKKISLEEAEEVDFTSVIGAVISPLDIKPKEMTEKQSKKDTLRVAYLAFAGSLVISAALSVTGAMRYLAAANEHDRLTRRIQELSYIQQIYDENETMKGMEAEYRAFDAMTFNRNEMMLMLIENLEEQLPSTVVVQSLSTSGSSISMSLTSPDKLTTAQLLMNLYEIPFIANASVPSMSRNEDAAGNTYWQYSISATYVDPLTAILTGLEAAAE